jgi:hypothetical protein
MPGAGKGPSRKSLVEAYLRQHAPAVINAAVLANLRRCVSAALGGARVADRYLLEIAEDLGFPVARELGGLPPDLRHRVHFHDFSAAEASLRDLAREYEAARAASLRERMQDCRRAVLRGKQRLTSLLRRTRLSPARRAEKEEIAVWFRVWLETPGLFPDWIALRRRALNAPDHSFRS